MSNATHAHVSATLDAVLHKAGVILLRGNQPPFRLNTRELQKIIDLAAREEKGGQE